MSLVHNFGFTNETASEVTVPLYKLGFLQNYGCTEDEPDEARMSNKTAPTDQAEVITYGCKDINTVSSSIKNLYPPTVKGGIQYVIKAEELLSTTSTDDATFRVDEPIVAYLTVRHPRSSNISTADIEKVLKRLLSAIYKEDGSTRLDDIMRSSLRPTTD